MEALEAARRSAARAGASEPVRPRDVVAPGRAAVAPARQGA
jgi:hypothetical protein